MPFRVENPGSTDCAFINVRRNRPAETSSSSDSATCATTSPLRSRARRGGAVTAAVDSFSAGITDAVDPCNAGTSPKTTAVAVVTLAAKSSTEVFNVGTIEMGNGAGGMNQRTRSFAQYENAIPAI